MTHVFHQKGFPPMHDTAVTQVQTTACTPHLSPSSPSLAQHIVAFLEGAPVQSPHEDTDLAPTGKPARGAPPKLPLQQLWLAVLVGTMRHARHLSSI